MYQGYFNIYYTLNEEILVSGFIPWSYNRGKPGINVNITAKALIDFTKTLRLNPMEWAKLPYNDAEDAFTLTVNGTKIKAGYSECR
ncbi:hypothetical protein Pmar_PMAR003310 [Perkinsus marinus ATCC 50983]|uniref:Uncharacterized protein n=1 Tax=Perkinsus marinus (strain ATCC 50983 / TXsc) TaxID=423536 RepID=C5KGZ6_PERM5|nr:hypothetical protein Pmar_PMAR003310 [Perkinsus marinus ATCC 50983]EER15858.1 hypothetical protein Pmar_PMAR003310 [Perkinsus marinus ATCC 50983]|eukprot:XP_002784062.1 hypothetical protein Pmar_PMAR003310 [Perkinsus marinus ATCC 50983]